MFPSPFESDLTDYKGTLQTTVLEGPGPVFAPTNIIRTDEDWHIKVDWEVHGPLVAWLDAEFRIGVYIESIGTGPEFDLPPVVVATLSVPVVLDPVLGKKRQYTQNVDILAGSIPAGVFKIATVMQLYERSTGNPTPFAGFVASGMVYVFDPA